MELRMLVQQLRRGNTNGIGYQQKILRHGECRTSEDRAVAYAYTH